MNKIPFLRVPPHFFPIFSLPIGMLIDSEILDGFWHSRCLNNRIDLPNMIRSLASGANASLVAKNGTKQPWVKIENSCDFDRNFGQNLTMAILYFFFRYGSKILHKKSQKFFLVPFLATKEVLAPLANDPIM